MTAFKILIQSYITALSIVYPRSLIAPFRLTSHCKPSINVFHVQTPVPALALTYEMRKFSGHEHSSRLIDYSFEKTTAYYALLMY